MFLLLTNFKVIIKMIRIDSYSIVNVIFEIILFFLSLLLTKPLQTKKSKIVRIIIMLLWFLSIELLE